MLYVINHSYGGFEVPAEVCSAIGCRMFDDSREVRTNPILIDWVRKHSDDTDLTVVEIPDKATDYEIFEYDGNESLIYVLNGHIHYADPVYDDD